MPWKVYSDYIFVADCGTFASVLGPEIAVIGFNDGLSYIQTRYSDEVEIGTPLHEITDVLQMARLFVESLNNTLELPLYQKYPVHLNMLAAINTIKPSITDHLEFTIEKMQPVDAIWFLKRVLYTGVTLSYHPNIIFARLFNKAATDLFYNAKAKVIQRKFRASISVPNMMLCFRRLAREFQDLRIE